MKLNVLSDYETSNDINPFHDITCFWVKRNNGFWTSKGDGRTIDILFLDWHRLNEIFRIIV